MLPNISCLPVILCYNKPMEKMIEPKLKKKADEEISESDIITEMFKAGAHFGHPKAKWHPRMRPYIFAAKNGIHIIDLEKTKEMLNNALEFMRSILSSGKQTLFVGTKRQAKNIVEDLAKSLDMPYVSERWIGGSFTNFKVIAKRISKIDELKTIIENSQENNYTKQEIAGFKKETERIEAKLGGLKIMKKLPGAVFVFDINEDKSAIKEAKIMKIPVAGLVDTNANPSQIDYPVPCNDDAIKTLELIAEIIKKELKNISKKEEK